MAGAASMAGAWFIHWAVRPVCGFYGPLQTGAGSRYAAAGMAASPFQMRYNIISLHRLGVVRVCPSSASVALMTH